MDDAKRVPYQYYFNSGWHRAGDAAFVSACYLAPVETSTAGLHVGDEASRETMARSLLSYKYGYDMAQQRYSGFGLRMRVHSFQPEALCVPKLFCFRVGGQSNHKCKS